MSKCSCCGSPPSVQPYYEEVNNETVQDHASIFRDTQYAAGVIVNEEFQIPAKDTDIQVCVQNLTNVVLGSYLWHPRYGSLKIVYWDSCKGKIGLLNEGLQGTAAPGSVVPECTAFVPSSRPCCADQDTFSLFPFLAQDFVVPPVGDQVTLKVTSTFGLATGTIIRIGSCLYHLDTINSSLEIVVTNQGAGCTPGSTIHAEDGDGNLQYLITSQIITACSATAVDTGKLIICSGADEHILDGDFAGQVPVLQDPNTNEVSFELLDTEERTCTTLTALFNILPTTISYVIFVDDESVFSINDIIQINFHILRWRVTSNATPGQLTISCTAGNPGITLGVLTGSPVCLQLSSETLQEDIDILTSEVVAVEALVNGSPFLGWVDISSVGAVYNSANSIKLPAAFFAPIKSALLPGSRIKYVDSSGNAKFAYVRDRTGSGTDLILTFAQTSDYTVLAGAITQLSYSYVSPLDFPVFFHFTSVLTGFASFASSGTYQVIGQNGLSANLFFSGGSNSAAFIATIPFIPLGSGTNEPIGILTNIQDNSLSVTDVGAALSIVVGGDPGAGLTFDGVNWTTWTGAGNKGADLLLNYRINQVV